jgi:oleate hydratase
MRTTSKAYLIGGGIGSLAAAAFMIRDGGILGTNILILDAAPTLGGSLDGGGTPALGYSLRGGRMLTTDNYECTWALFKSIHAWSTAICPRFRWCRWASRWRTASSYSSSRTQRRTA